MAALSLALASVPALARPLPFLGTMQISLSWSPGNPPPGVTTTFHATASDGDGSVRIATICYGDGSPCQYDTRSLSPTELAIACVLGDNWDHQWRHRYMNPGRYRVTLTVTSRGCPVVDDETQSLTSEITVG